MDNTAPINPLAGPQEPISPLTGPQESVSPQADAQEPISPQAGPRELVGPQADAPESVDPQADSQKPISPQAGPPEPVGPQAGPREPAGPQAGPQEPVSPQADSQEPVGPAAGPREPVGPQADSPEPVNPQAGSPEPISSTAGPPESVSPQAGPRAPVGPQADAQEPISPAAGLPESVSPQAGPQKPISPQADSQEPISPAAGPPGSATLSQASPQVLAPLQVSAADVLGCLFASNETVCLRVYADKKGSTFSGLKLQCLCGKFLNIKNTLKQHNAMDRGISFVVNYGGQSDADITRVNAQFVEMDTCSFDEQQKKINAFPIKPSMVIKTQKSLHVYYFMDKTARVDRFREIQSQLVKYFDGDPACVNESRAMRLPGFYHCKTDTQVMVECVCFHPERRYTQDQLAALLPKVDATPPERKSGTEKGLDIVMLSCSFLQHCKDDAKSLSEPEWYAMITNLACFEGGTSVIHTLSKPYPGYDMDETQKKINHYLESGTGPMTCKTICEKGFRCPKFASGGCSVKSPAALCYRPMSVDALRAVLHATPVKGSMIEDIQAAKKFIVQYLYNQDMATADVFITSEIRKHFDFNTSVLKMLKAVYKTANKEHQAKVDLQKKKAAVGNAPWYMPTSKGVQFLPGVLAEHMAKTIPAFYAAAQYYFYSDGVYREMSDMQAQKLVQEQMLATVTKMSQIVDAERQWRLHIQKDISDLNCNPYIINVRNGLYSVLENTLEAHTPEYYSTVRLNVNYDDSADCPLFKQFLEESMGGDMAQVALIQEMLGYFLIPVNSAQKCFVIVGVGGAGKSVLLRVLNDILLGRRNVSNVSWQALNERFKAAELFGKLANIFADLPTKNIEDDGNFKALVGEDYLTVEKKNKDPFSFQSTARLLFSCNSIPKNYSDRSDGFYRRLIIIRFNHMVPRDKRDPGLLEKFRAEADGIFQFALEGLRRLITNDYEFSETSVNMDELQQYREMSDSVFSFIRECCELDASYVVGSTELFNAYKAYCVECGLRPYSQKSFVQQIKEINPNISSGVDQLGKRRILKGIKLGDILI